MRRCNEPNPEHADAACVQPEGRHIDHLDGKGRLWSNAPVQEQIARAPKRRKGGGRGNSNASAEAIKRIQEAAASAQPERRVNPLADGRRPVSTGPSMETVAAWNKEAWAHETSETLHEFLITRAEPFTTPEHLWPLIDSPNGDMRAMSVVVQAALRGGWIEEVDSKRLRDVYRTRDGVEFAMNKLVPIYRSLIFDSKEV